MSKLELKNIASYVYKDVNRIHQENNMFDTIVYFVRGKGNIRIGVQDYQYTGNTYAYIPKGMGYSEMPYIDTEVRVLTFGYFNKMFVVQEGIYFDVDGQIKEYVDTAIREQNNKENYYDYSCGLIIEQIMLRMSRCCNSFAEVGEMDTLIGLVLDYIDKNIESDIDFQKLVSAYGYSYDYFRHSFKKKMDVSPRRYLLEEKISRVKHSLVYSDESIAKLSKRFAFKNQSNLTNVFKRIEGCSPKEYRKKVKSNMIEQKGD